MQTSSNKIAFIIRFHYAEGDPRFDWRFIYFRDQVLPRILAQTIGGFDIAIRCNPAHANLFEMLHPSIRTFQVKDEQARYKTVGGKQYFYDFVPWEDVIGLPEYELQLGLDSDDLIHAQYLEKVLQDLKKVPQDISATICFQPQLYDVKTGNVVDMKQQYSTTHGSAFFALYQPPGWKPYRFAYEVSHLKMRTIASVSLFVPTKGYCLASCHDFNESTGL